MTELTPEQASEKCHKHLVAGLRLIRPAERVQPLRQRCAKSRREKNDDRAWTRCQFGTERF